MKILITGAKGFIGSNLVAELETLDEYELLKYDKENTKEDLINFIEIADFVIHLAGINRPQSDSEFADGNKGFTEQIVELLKHSNKNIPLLMTSSIQATIDNLYGNSKKSAEEAISKWSKETGNKGIIYRLPNVFGKWCKPNYNSVVATFMHNIARSLPIQINDENYELTLVYIDDILNEIKDALAGHEHLNENGYAYVPVTHNIKLGEIAEIIKSFRNSRNNLSVADMSNDLTKKLYSAYLSYLPIDKFSYPLKMNIDNRGSFTEFIRTLDRGQISVNISKPGIIKGNHWHHTKNEKFLVVSGKGIIRFRNINTEEIFECSVSGEKLEVVDIPTGYTHNIENIGDADMVTIMWVNECFDSSRPDTYYEEV